MPLTLLIEGDKFRNEATARMQSLRSFISEIRDAVKVHRDAEKERLDQDFPSVANNITSDTGKVDAATAALFHYSSHMTTFTGEIPRLLNYSLILQIFSALEEVGRDLCDEIHSRDPTLPISFKDLRFGSDFDAINLYLTKICKIKFVRWQELGAFRKIRNKIIHRGGMISTDEERQREFLGDVQPLKGIHIFLNGRFYIPGELVDLFLAIVQELFEAVFLQRNFGPVGTFLPQPHCSGGMIIETKGSEFKVKIVGEDDFG